MSKGYTLTPSGPMPVKQLYTLTGGKAYPVDKAYTLTGGTARLWYQRGTPLGSLAVGSTVKIAVGGKDYDWLVVHQGLPGSIYDTSCDGTWLLMKDIYDVMRFGSTNLFINSSILYYLNTTFYEAVDERIRSLIKVATIPYIAKNNTSIASSGDLRAWVFLLSGTEVGFINESWMNTEGTKLAYFDSASKRVAYNGSSAAEWWLRSPNTLNSAYVWYVKPDGSSGASFCTNTYGVRPALILPQDVLVDDTGHIIAA